MRNREKKEEERMKQPTTTKGIQECFKHSWNGIGMKLEYGYLLIHSNFLNMISIRISISNEEKAE